MILLNGKSPWAVTSEYFAYGSGYALDQAESLTSYSVDYFSRVCADYSVYYDNNGFDFLIDED